MYCTCIIYVLYNTLVFNYIVIISCINMSLYLQYTCTLNIQMVPPLILAIIKIGRHPKELTPWSPLVLHTPQAPHFPKFELDSLLVLRKETSKQYKITLQHHTFLAVYKYDKNSDLCLPSNLGSDWLVNPAHNIS